MITKKIGLLSLGAIIFFTLQSFGAMEVLMRFEGLDVPKDFRTKSQINGYADGWAEIYAISTGLSVDTGSTASRAAGKPQYQDFTVIKLVDEITPSLIFTSAAGKHITKVTIVWLSGTGETYGKSMEFILEDVMISSSAITGSQGEESGTESVTLNWGKLTMNSFTQDDRGNFNTKATTSVIIDATTGNVSK